MKLLKLITAAACAAALAVQAQGPAGREGPPPGGPRGGPPAGPAGGPPAPFSLVAGLAYAGAGRAQRLDILRPAGTQPVPVVLWLPPAGLGDAAPAAGPGLRSTLAQRRYPTPLAALVAQGYAVVTADASRRADEAADVQAVLAYLASQAPQQHLDLANVALVRPQPGGHAVQVLRSTLGPAAAGQALSLASGPDDDYDSLRSDAGLQALAALLAQHLQGGRSGGGPRQLDIADPVQAWVDPVMAAPAGARYVLYPTPSRGAGTEGSVLVFVPPGQPVAGQRLPVIYYLHGGNGSQREGAALLPAMAAAMQAGRMPPAIVVLVQALPIGWYLDADTSVPGVLSGPVETVLVRDLVPFIDAHYPTIASPRGRGLEGWSMGGFGALRLAFKYPGLFGAASSLSGAVIDWEDEVNPQYLANTFGPSDGAQRAASVARFNEAHPATWAARNSAAVRAGVAVRLLVGDADWLYSKAGKPITRLFSDKLKALDIPHTYQVLPGIDHMLPMAVQAGRLAYPAEFWQAAFGR